MGSEASPIRSQRAFAPLLIGLPALLYVCDAAVRASCATLGRDQGIFQYLAWAVARGDRLYRDVRDINGPLATLVHFAFQRLGGESERTFRILDLAVVGGSAAFVGACLPATSDASTMLSSRQRVAGAAGWAFAAWTSLTAQYLAYGFWDTAQRESFFDVFVMIAIGAQLVAQRKLREGASRTAWLSLATAGAASIVPWFGKPTYVLYTLCALAVLSCDDLPVTRWRRAGAFAVGGIVGASAPLAFLLTYGDAEKWIRITIEDVGNVYRFIWPKSAETIARLPGYDRTLLLAVVTSATLVVLVSRRKLPLRALLVASMPLCGIASVFIQGKGFVYHFHPVTAGTALVLLVLAFRASTAFASESTVVRGVVWIALSLGIAARSAVLAKRAPFPPVPAGATSEERLAAYARPDFAPIDARHAAAFVKANTTDRDRVQIYGTDPYLLFLAERASATPYIYAFDLNVDSVLATHHDAKTDPSRAVEARDRHERDFAARIAEAPPAAFLFVDRSAFLTAGSAAVDFASHCPEASKWVFERYRQSATFGGIHVWLPKGRDVR